MPRKPKEESAKAKAAGFKFRLNFGVHQEHGKMYKQGEIIESATDLSKHNNPVGPRRFDPIGEVVETEESAAAASQDGFEEMTVEELKTYAAEGGIDLMGVTKKEDIIAKLREYEEM